MEIFRIIYSFIPYEYRIKYVLNKYIFKIYIKDVRKIKLIQQFYRSVRLNKDYFMNINRFLLYRFYILEYPEEHLYTYPEFLINKLNKKNEDNLSRSTQLYSWLQNNSFVEKRSYVRNFFVENKIRSEEIMAAGW